ncbi:MAG: hypothetical protein GJU77_05250 [Ferrovum sp.]|jgi:uncharacterized ion transporter superfamily protein YfcC|nr:hypothetical protein [Ferrovum sp.]NDU90202.1 hypothetical protein [Ferrovum sp.]
MKPFGFSGSRGGWPLLTGILFILGLALFRPALAAPVAAQNPNAVQMMEAFQKQQGDKDDGVTPVDDHKKKIIMFIMGVPLILMVLVTGVLGIGMGIYGKPWFVPHMIMAGLTMTLALVHAIVGVAWFFPF